MRFISASRVLVAVGVVAAVLGPSMSAHASGQQNSANSAGYRASARTFTQASTTIAVPGGANCDIEGSDTTIGIASTVRDPSGVPRSGVYLQILCFDLGGPSIYATVQVGANGVSRSMFVSPGDLVKLSLTQNATTISGRIVDQTAGTSVSSHGDAYPDTTVVFGDARAIGSSSTAGITSVLFQKPTFNGAPLSAATSTKLNRTDGTITTSSIYAGGGFKLSYLAGR